MLITSPHQPRTPTVDRLVQIWEKRYIPDLSSITDSEDTMELRQGLVDAASLEGRCDTASKITKRVVAIKCQMASLKTKSLYSYLPSVINFTDTRRLSDFALIIYLKLAEIYQQSSPTAADAIQIQTTLLVSYHNRNKAAMGAPLSMAAWGMPPIEQLAMELEPLLLEFQQQHILSKDSRTLGFLTTLLNFCNDLILQGLSRTEKLLIYPYFKFIEEQVAVPWQRVCLAAGRHALDSPTFTIVEQCLPLSQAIAQRTYRRLTVGLPHHCSRRGTLSEPGVMHSCIRDLQMNQAYFWLAFLEASLSSVEDELLPLCIMVFPGVGVSWKLIEHWNQVLFSEICAVLTPDQVEQVRPYANEYIQAFKRKQSSFQEVPEEVRMEAQTNASNPLGTLRQLHPTVIPSVSSHQAASVNPSTVEAADVSPTAEDSSQLSDVDRLKEKMAKLEAELLEARQKLNNLFPKDQA